MMTRFTTLLQEIDRHLDLHQPAKGRILLEIAADMEDLYGFYLDQGMSEDEARSRTEEKFDISADSIAELALLHQSGVRRLMDRLSVRAQTRWERSVLVLLLLFMAALGGPVILREEAFRQASPFIWPVIGIGASAVILSLIKTYQLYLKKDHSHRTMRNGLPSLIMLSGASLIVGLFGFSVELYLAVKKLLFNIEGLWLYVIDWLLRGSPMLLLSMLITMVTALLWFILIQKVLKIEQAEVGYLLAG